MNSLIFPPYVHEGDRAIILSPSSKIDKSFLKGAKKRLKSWGLEVIIAKHAGSAHGTYAGSIQQRLKDLQEAMDDEKAKVILCSRGGYGAVHLVGQLDFTRFRQHPKWLIGFSDITALHNVFQQNGFASLHAPMARHLTVEPEDDFCCQALKDILFGNKLQEETSFSYTCPAHKLNRKGEGTGILRGGNLAVLYGLRGTPYDIPAEGTVLFIEDIGERPHAVERMMYNLKLGGVLERLSGLIIGQFTEYEENMSLGKELYGALADLVKEYDYPICFGFPVGHVTMNVPMINGAQVTLEVGKKKRLRIADGSFLPVEIQTNLINNRIRRTLPSVVSLIQIHLFYEHETTCISGGHANRHRLAPCAGKRLGRYRRGDENGNKLL